MICRGCDYLDTAKGRCLHLLGSNFCPQCRGKFPAYLDDCPECHVPGQRCKSSLQLDDGGWQSSYWCPLTSTERDTLTQRQNHMSE